MVKGIVVESRETRRGEVHRLRSRKWVFVPYKNCNPNVIKSQGAAFNGNNGKNIFIVDNSSAYDIDTDKSYVSVKKFALKQSLHIPEYPSSTFMELTALLWLMNRKAALKKLLSLSYEKQIPYLQNPYLFYYKGHIDFHSAAVISERTLLPSSLAEKVYAASLHAVNEAYGRSQGSLPMFTVIKQVSHILCVEPDEIYDVIGDASKLRYGKIVFAYDRVYLSRVFFLCKRSLYMLENNSETFPFVDTDDEHILSLMDRKYTILAGSAGTGKTTLLRKIASMSDRIILSATTGKAAKLLGNNASTVHSLLGYGRKGFTVDNLDCDLLIVDESSMLDWSTLHAILKAAQRVIFSGDPGQLPPVEGESVFRKMVDMLPVVKLTKKWRFTGTEPNIRTYRVMNAFSAIMLIRKIVYNLKKNDKSFQVITPIHGGPLGTKRLNEMIRDIVNPNAKGGANGIRENDKVIVMDNVYLEGELIASNGQMGYVVPSDDSRYIGVHFPNDGTVLLEPKEIDLAYALTVHKFQGSESEYVIFVIPPHIDNEFITDEMMFVGTTRGKKITYVIDGVGIVRSNP